MGMFYWEYSKKFLGTYLQSFNEFVVRHWMMKIEVPRLSHEDFTSKKKSTRCSNNSASCNSIDYNGSFDFKKTFYVFLNLATSKIGLCTLL